MNIPYDPSSSETEKFVEKLSKALFDGKVKFQEVNDVKRYLNNYRSQSPYGVRGHDMGGTVDSSSREAYEKLEDAVGKVLSKLSGSNLDVKGKYEEVTMMVTDALVKLQDEGKRMKTENKISPPTNLFEFFMIERKLPKGFFTKLKNKLTQEGVKNPNSVINWIKRKLQTEGVRIDEVDYDWNKAKRSQDTYKSPQQRYRNAPTTNRKLPSVVPTSKPGLTGEMGARDFSARHKDKLIKLVDTIIQLEKNLYPHGAAEAEFGSDNEWKRSITNTILNRNNNEEYFKFNVIDDDHIEIIVTSKGLKDLMHSPYGLFYDKGRWKIDNDINDSIWSDLISNRAQQNPFPSMPRGNTP